MFEFFIPLPLDAPQTHKRVRGASIFRRNFNTGKFKAVKDFEYIRVAKLIGETQVGINLFYLVVDKSTIVGYRNNDHYFLREGAKTNGKRSNK